MKINVKRIMSGVAAFTMTASLMTSYPTGYFKSAVAPFTAGAEESDYFCGTDENNKVYWSLNSATSTLTISGSGKMKDYLSPNSAPWKDKYFTNVVIGDGVTSVGDYAFSENDNITSLTLSKSVETIGDWAFYQCYNLKTIEIYGLIESVGKSAFSECGSYVTGGNVTIYNCKSKITNQFANYNVIIKHIYAEDNPCVCIECGESTHSFSSNNECGKCGLIEGTCGTYATYTLDSKGNLVISGSGAIDNNAFSGKEKIKSVVIGDGITEIGYKAFYSCMSLKTVTLGENVATIGKSAFEKCTNLEDIVIPDSVTKIIASAFKSCGSLSSITIGKNVSDIGGYAFKDCKNLVDIVIPDSVTRIDTNAFSNCTNLSTIVIGKNVKNIYSSAFEACSFSEIVLPDSLNNLDSNVFSNCSNLKKITAPCKLKGNSNFKDRTDVTYTHPNTDNNCICDRVGCNEPLHIYTIDLHKCDKCGNTTEHNYIDSECTICKAETMTVRWISAYGQEIQKSEISNTEFNLETLKQSASVPSRLGYINGVWELDSNSVQEFTKGKVMTFIPKYEEAEVYYTITVDGGTPDSAQYKATQIATVTANPAETGMKFAWWKDEYGKIVSYSEVYKFYVACDTSLTAVYIDETDEVEKSGTANIVSATYNPSTQKMTFVSQLTVPSGAKMLFAGLVATTDVSLKDSLDTINARFVKGRSYLTCKSYRYTWNVGKSKGVTAVVRAYVKYEINGKVIEKYSDPYVLKGE